MYSFLITWKMMREKETKINALDLRQLDPIGAIRAGHKSFEIVAASVVRRPVVHPLGWLFQNADRNVPRRAKRYLDYYVYLRIFILNYNKKCLSRIFVFLFVQVQFVFKLCRNVTA